MFGDRRPAADFLERNGGCRRTLGAGVWNGRCTAYTCTVNINMYVVRFKLLKLTYSIDSDAGEQATVECVAFTNDTSVEPQFNISTSTGADPVIFSHLKCVNGGFSRQMAM